MKTTPSHRSDFLRDLKGAFPQVRDAVNSWGGLLHLEMTEFRNLVQDAIDSGDVASAAKAFHLAERHFVHGRPALRNAIAVSFLEHMNFEDDRVRRQWAWELLPASLKDVVHSLKAQAAAVSEAVPRQRKAKQR